MSLLTYEGAVRCVSCAPCIYVAVSPRVPCGCVGCEHQSALVIHGSGATHSGVVVPAAGSARMLLAVPKLAPDSIGTEPYNQVLACQRALHLPWSEHEVGRGCGCCVSCAGSGC